MVTVYAELVDNDELLNSDIVYRRVAWESLGGRSKFATGETPSIRPNCFPDQPHDRAVQYGLPDSCMSCGLHSILAGLGEEPSKMLENFPELGLVAVRVEDLRHLKRGNGDPCPQGVMRAPTNDEPWHAVVFDLDSEARPRKEAVKKAVSKIAWWHVPLVA